MRQNAGGGDSRISAFYGDDDECRIGHQRRIFRVIDLRSPQACTPSLQVRETQIKAQNPFTHTGTAQHEHLCAGQLQTPADIGADGTGANDDNLCRHLVADMKATKQKTHHEHRTDHQKTQVIKKGRLLAFDFMTDELTNPGQHKN